LIDEVHGALRYYGDGGGYTVNPPPLTDDILTRDGLPTLHFFMGLWSVVDAVSPHARVATAVAPFVASMILRFVLGSNRLIQWLIWGSTMWFLINVLLAPYSPGMYDDLQALRRLFQ
jgi:hypothetical protein